MTEPRRFKLWVCPDCGGYMAEHTGKAIADGIHETVWHNHDGRHVDFELVDVVEIRPPEVQQSQT